MTPLFIGYCIDCGCEVTRKITVIYHGDEIHKEYTSVRCASRYCDRRHPVDYENTLAFWSDKALDCYTCRDTGEIRDDDGIRIHGCPDCRAEEYKVFTDAGCNV